MTDLGGTESPASFPVQPSDQHLVDHRAGSCVPEPSTWAMMLLGFAGLGLAGYKARKRAPIAA
jgi:PEP-CTERM motif